MIKLINVEQLEDNSAILSELSVHMRRVESVFSEVFCAPQLHHVNNLPFCLVLIANYY